MRPNLFKLSVISTAMAAFASVASAQSLKIGDAAPPLTVGKWVKGEPVAGFEKGKIYVIEFWATWCVPCRVTIPKLSQMQAKHKEVVFIGQDVWEQDMKKVEPFVKEMGDKMNYRVATDDTSKDENGAMATNWLDASGFVGLPVAFIVDRGGKIAWVGPAAKLEPELDKVLKAQPPEQKTP